ncbi:unnamed protein product, partial [marine sediment metagenome]
TSSGEATATLARVEKTRLNNKINPGAIIHIF